MKLLKIMKLQFFAKIGIFSIMVLMVVVTFHYVVSSEQLVKGIPNKNASAPTNANPSGAQNSTISTSNNNTSTVTGSGSETKHNVTTSAGNGGHIYRGGTISGSGGE